MSNILSGVDTQEYISNRVPLPVDIVADTAYSNSVSGESVQLYYFNSEVPTSDAGQAAGTLVVAKLAYTGVLDRMGAMIGNDDETSLVWTTDTVLPIANIQPCRIYEIESPAYKNLYDLATAVTDGFTAGQRCIDHRTGMIYGLKATTGTSDTAAYKVQTQTTDSALASAVKITDGTDVLDVLVQDAAFGTATKGLAIFGKYQASPTTYTDGDAAPILLDVNGRVVLGGDIQIGAVEIKNSSTDDRVIVKTGNTFAKTDLAMGVSDATALEKLTSIETQLAFGTGAMAASHAITLATDDTQFGAVGAAADVDGNVHGQLRFIGEAVDTLETALPVPAAPQAYGIDAAGVDAYTTVVTAGAARSRMSVSLQGTYDAIVSIDSGTTETFYIPAGSSHVFENLVIANGATVQGKNAGAGENYTKLAITVR